MSRGLSRAEAEQTVVLAFFEDVLAETPPVIQDGFRTYLARALGHP
jgi:Fe-S cluster assembly scaffold protein SufB